MGRLELHPVADALLEILDMLVRKFDNPAALRADEMVVVAMTEHVFENTASLAQPHLTHQTAFDQQTQSSIHSSFRYAGLAVAQDEHEVICIEMVVRREHSVEHTATCSGHFEITLSQKSLEPSYGNVVFQKRCVSISCHYTRMTSRQSMYTRLCQKKNKWLRDKDSNLEIVIQSHVCCQLHHPAAQICFTYIIANDSLYDQLARKMEG